MLIVDCSHDENDILSEQVSKLARNTFCETKQLVSRH